VENGSQGIALGEVLDKLEEKCKELNAIGPNSAYYSFLDVNGRKAIIPKLKEHYIS